MGKAISIIAPALAAASGGGAPSVADAVGGGSRADGLPKLSAAKSTDFFKSKEVRVDADRISDGIRDLLSALEPVVQAQDKNVGKFRVDEIQLNLAVNASGGVSLIGSFEAGIEGGITITLKRQE